MFCIKCGFHNPEEAEYCYKCGKNIFKPLEQEDVPIVAIQKPSKIEPLPISGQTAVHEPTVDKLDQNNSEKNINESSKTTCQHSTLSKGSPVPAFPQHKGIGGWLLILCLGFTVFSPLITLVQLIVEYNNASNYSDRFPDLMVVTVIDIILSLGMTTFSIVAGINLWQIRPGAIQLAKKYLLCVLGYCVIAAILPFMAGLPSSANSALGSHAVKVIFMGGIYFAIWYSYLNKSQRVRATFAASMWESSQLESSTRIQSKINSDHVVCNACQFEQLTPDSSKLSIVTAKQQEPPVPDPPPVEQKPTIPVRVEATIEREQKHGPDFYFAVSTGVIFVLAIILMICFAHYEGPAPHKDFPKVADLPIDYSQIGAISRIVAALSSMPNNTDLWRRAAGRGDADAQFGLGCMYFNGYGVTMDYQLATKWFRKSAEQGDIRAQFYLGLMYYDGKGVPVDYQEALKYFWKPAEQGDGNAQYFVGRMYYYGKALTADNELSYAWANASMADGNKDAKILVETVAKTLSPDQISRAQELSKQWIDKNRKHSETGSMSREENTRAGISVSGAQNVVPPQTPKSPMPPERIQVDNEVQQANLVRQVKPPYPPLARQARIQGAVILEAIISRQGKVDQLRVISGHPLLVQAALDAVRQWKYRPTIRNGKSVEVVTTITVNFNLSGR